MNKEITDFLKYSISCLIWWSITQYFFEPLIAIIVYFVGLLSGLLIFTLYLLYKKGWL